jgi:hypothetical protein
MTVGPFLNFSCTDGHRPLLHLISPFRSLVAGEQRPERAPCLRLLCFSVRVLRFLSRGEDISLTKAQRPRRGNDQSFLNRRKRRVRPGRQLSSRSNLTQLPVFKSPPSLSLVTREQQLECSQDFRGRGAVQLTDAFQRGGIDRSKKIASHDIIITAPSDLHAKRGERNVFAERTNQLRG